MSINAITKLAQIQKHSTRLLNPSIHFQSKAALSLSTTSAKKNIQSIASSWNKDRNNQQFGEYLNVSIAIGAASLLIPSVILLNSIEEEKKKKQNIVGEFLIEKYTNTPFPLTLSYPEGLLRLISVGVRTLTIFKFNTYSVGFYVEDKQASDRFKSWKDRTSEELKGDESFFQEILQEDFVKAIRVVPSRTVQGSHLFRGFADNLLPRLKSKLPDDDAHVKELLDAFQICLPNKRNFPKGQPVDFVCDRNQHLTCYIDGQKVAVLKSKELVWALFDIYIGPNSKAPKIKRKVAGGVYRLLRQQ